MGTGVLLGLLAFVALAGAPVAMVLLLVRTPAAYERCRRLKRRLRLRRSWGAGAGVVPIEELAADLRRLRRALRAPESELTGSRRRAALLAYDRALVATARALEVPTTLRELPAGAEQEAERRHLERALQGAGLVWGHREDHQPDD